jgi:O-antigen/teichoic acid export membrane protein
MYPEATGEGKAIMGSPVLTEAVTAIGRQRDLVQFARRLLGSRLFLNVTSLMGGRGLAALMMLLAMSYPARILGPRSFGMVGFGTSIAAYAAILLVPGLGWWGNRAVARDKVNAGKILFIVNATQLALACLAYAGLVIFAFFLPDPAERRVVLTCGLILFTIALSTDWLFNGLELTHIPVILNLLNLAISLLAIFMLVRSSKDMLLYAAIIPTGSLLVAGLSYWHLFKNLGIACSLTTLAEFRRALVASAALSVGTSLAAIYSASGIIVRAYLGPAELGIFLAAYKLIEISGGIPRALGVAFLPRLARLLTTVDPTAPARARLFAQAHIIAAFLIASFLFVEAPSIIGILYGSPFEPSIAMLRIMAFGLVFNYAVSGYTNCLIPFGGDAVILRVAIVSAVVALGGGLLLVPRFGALGMAIAISLVDLLGWAVSLPTYRHLVGKFQFRTWLRPALGGLLVITSSMLLQEIHAAMWIRLPTGCVAYLLAVVPDLKSVVHQAEAAVNS